MAILHRYCIKVTTEFHIKVVDPAKDPLVTLSHIREIAPVRGARRIGGPEGSDALGCYQVHGELRPC
jgi:hypothetical protein